MWGNRLYLLRRGYLHHVTTNHRLVQQMKMPDTRQQASNSNLLWFALGMGNEGHDASYSGVGPLEDGDT